jgi:hypothetical protein
MITVSIKRGLVVYFEDNSVNRKTKKAINNPTIENICNIFKFSKG